MNRPAEVAGELPQKRPAKGLLGDEPVEVVCGLEKQDMTVRLLSLRGSEPVIEMALGTEARSFSLPEFLHFWLTIVEVGSNEISCNWSLEKCCDEQKEGDKEV